MLRRLSFFIITAAGVLAAQDPPSIAGRLNYVSGAVSFQPAGVSDWVQATVNRPLTVGDQLYADNGARAEVHVPGAAFRLSSNTAFEFMNLDDRNVQVRLSEGTLNVRVRSLEGGQNFEVDTPNLAFSVNRPGEYRIDTNPDTYETRVTAWDGDGEVAANGAAFRVRPREQAVVTGQDQVRYNVYAAPGYDGFDNWVSSRDGREDRAQSARYVSPAVVGYEDLDEYGSWRRVPDYGEAWVPNNVAAGWTPYHDGHWAWVDPWGWTWVDDQPWGFAPFHYGRWAFAGRSWCWLPGPVAVAPVYAPALVAWVGFGGGLGVSLGTGGGPEVGWFPLGPRDVYIPAYRASPTYVTRVNTTNTTIINNTTITNVYNNYIQTGAVSATANSVNRNAVVAVPQNALTSARSVQQVATRVTPNQLAAIKTVEAAPRVAPQVASVLGRSAGGSAPRPPAAVIGKPVVAKSAPPPPRASFQQRQSLLAQNPGRPLQIQQQRQLAQSAPRATAARPQVRVVAQAPQVTPPVSNAPAPRPVQTPGGVSQRRGNVAAVPPTPHPQQPAPPRPFEPPSVQQRQAPPAQPNRPAEVPRPAAPAQQNRPFEPPSVQQRQSPATPAQPTRPPEVAPQQQRLQSQERPQTPTTRPTQVEPPRRDQPPVEASPQFRPPAPPAPRQSPPVQPPRQERQAAPPPQREQTRPQPPPSPQQRQAQPPPQERKPAPRPTDEKNKKEER